MLLNDRRQCGLIFMIAPSDLLVPHTAPLAVNCHIVIEVPENMHHVRFG